MTLQSLNFQTIRPVVFDVGCRHKVRPMNVSTSRLMFKGLEDEVYTGLADGRIVGIQERIDHALSGFQTEPDCRNPEFVTPPVRSYEEMGSALVRMRSRLRR